MIPSNSLTAAPAFVATSPVAVLGIANRFNLNGGTITDYAPSVAMYASAGSDGKVHLYGVNLGNASASPIATQISDLAVSALTDICNFAQAQTNLSDPTTLFVLLHIKSATGCNPTGDLYEVAHYTDSASTTPLQVGVNNFVPIYQSSGVLSGFVSLDAASKNLNFYTSDSFTSPQTLVPGVTSYSALYDMSQTNHFLFGGNFVFLDVTFGTGDHLLRVDGSGNASSLYTANGTIGIAAVEDDSNVYFTDTRGNPAQPSIVNIIQEPLSGVGAPLQMYMASYAAGTSAALVGSNGSVLVFDSISTDTTTFATTSTLQTVPVGQSSTTATTIGSSFAGSIAVFMGAANLDNPASDALFVTVSEVSSTGGTTTTRYSSEVLTPSGTVQQALLANSIFGNRTSQLSGGIFQIKGITDTGGGYGGGTVYTANIGSLAATAFTTQGAGSYTVPAANTAGFFGLAKTIGAGSLFNHATSTTSGLAYDLAQPLMVPITIANTDVRSL